MSNIMLLSEAIISSASSNLPFLNHHHILMEVNVAENHEGIHNDDLPSAEIF